MAATNVQQLILITGSLYATNTSSVKPWFSAIQVSRSFLAITEDRF